MNSMCYREEAIECVKDYVLQVHKQLCEDEEQYPYK